MFFTWGLVLNLESTDYRLVHEHVRYGMRYLSYGSFVVHADARSVLAVVVQSEVILY